MFAFLRRVYHWFEHVADTYFEDYETLRDGEGHVWFVTFCRTCRKVSKFEHGKGCDVCQFGMPFQEYLKNLRSRGSTS